MDEQLGDETWEGERRLERRQGVEYIVLGFGGFPRHVQAEQPIRSTDNEHEAGHLVSTSCVDDVIVGSNRGLDSGT